MSIKERANQVWNKLFLPKWLRKGAMTISDLASYLPDLVFLDEPIFISVEKVAEKYKIEYSERIEYLKGGNYTVIITFDLGNSWLILLEVRDNKGNIIWERKNTG